VAVKKSELQAAALNAVRWAIVLGIVISLLSLGLALVIARRITRPIEEMRGKAAMVLAGREISFEPDLPELGALWSALKQAVADRSHSDAARHESEGRLAAVVTSSQAAIVSTTLDGAITSWNAAAERLYGYTAGEMLGQSIRRLLPAKRQNDETAMLAGVAAGETMAQFEATRLHKNGSTVEVSITVSPIHDRDGKVVGLSGIAHDITERKRAEELQFLLMREINHRTKNMLSVVQSIVRQTAASDTAEFIKHFSARIQALSANQDLLIKSDWRGVDLEDLVRAQLGSFVELIGTRIMVHGPRLRLAAAAAQSIGMALHELATNAGKYGALSGERGCVDIEWRLDGDAFSIGWTERDGPDVEPPKRHGFGSTVISTVAKASVDGEVVLDYAATGLIWRLKCSAAKLLERRSA
jgi:PAS domain S-box-containing protein